METIPKNVADAVDVIITETVKKLSELGCETIVMLVVNSKENFIDKRVKGNPYTVVGLLDAEHETAKTRIVLGNIRKKEGE